MACLCLCGLLTPGCSKAGEREVERALRDLITAVTPPPSSASVPARNDWFGQRQALLERLRQGGPELGRAALERFHEEEDAILEVRSGLLDIAAHAAPEDTRQLLVELIDTYGPELGLRTRACGLLARTSPETAVELLGGIIADTQRDRTYPPDDQMIEAWVLACDATGHDPVEGLAAVVTDPRRTADGRHRAARALGEYPSNRGRQALESVLTESSGNNYLRRLAAQSLQKTLPTEELCATLRRIVEREIDTNFIVFLADMLEASCP
jgi:HEAT repeat protein